MTWTFSLVADAMRALQLAHTYAPSSDEESARVVPVAPSSAVSSRVLVPAASSAAYQVHASLASEGRSVSYVPQLEASWYWGCAVSVAPTCAFVTEDESFTLETS